jgi:hypothetical protein
LTRSAISAKPADKAGGRTGLAVLESAGAAHSDHIRWGGDSQWTRGRNPRGEEVRHFAVVAARPFWRAVWTFY